MIIIKTSDGDVFVNEKETVSVIHNRDEHTAYIYENKMKGTFWHIVPPIKHVESVNYINEQTGNEWKDNGSQVEDLQRLLADTKNELKWCYEMNKKLEDNLRSFASEMIQIVQYHHEQLPDGIRKQMRDHGENMKAIANDENWLYRRQWLEAHKVAEASEADVTDKLHKTIEEQTAEIRQLKDVIKRMECDKKHEPIMADKEKTPTWWQRLTKV
jgi:hypothetical protein